MADLPDTYSEPESTDAHRPDEWWKESFQDSVLNRLIDTVLGSNFDISVGVARVQQAQAQARIAKAAFLPSVQASGSVASQNTPSNAGFGAQFQALGGGGDSTAGPVSNRIGVTTYSLGLDFSYELDFWGRVRNDAAAAGQDYLASEADFLTATIGVISETITAYYQVVEIRDRIKLTEETIGVLTERDELAEDSYDGGLISSFQLYQIRQDLRNTEATLPQLETQLTDALGRLAILSGRYHADVARLLSDSSPIHQPPTPIPTGLPVQLLTQRPDVLAAYRRMEAARYRIGARRAELLPSLALSGTVGLQSADASGLFDADQWFRNLAANLVAPIFQGGRRRASVSAARARFNELAATYGRTVVTAVHEVETSLERLSNESRRHALIASQSDEADAAVDLQSRRYSRGVAGYTDYLDALRTALNVRSSLTGARRDLALARLAVHRALGRSWTETNRLMETAEVEMLEADSRPAASGALDGGQN